jgi:hypothetical protein
VTSARLEKDLQVVDDDGVLVLPLEDLRHLVVEPELDPFTDHRSPERAGVEDLAATLTACRHLPEQLTVRVVLPAGAPEEPSASAAEAALHRRAAALASVAWRDGMAVRSMGRAQLPLGLVIAFVAAVLAYSAGATAANTSGTGAGLLAVLAGLSITIAWVVSWMVIEAATLDWRPMARLADAYELLAQARLEVVREPAS